MPLPLVLHFASMALKPLWIVLARLHSRESWTPEYPSKIGWGHSSAEYAVKLAQRAQVKRLALTHHDPLREDDAVDRVLAGIRDGLQAAGSSLQVSAAVEGEIVEIQPCRSKP